MSNTTNEMKSEVTLTFTFTSGNVFDAKKKKEIMQRLAGLPMEDQERIEQIVTNPKALSALKKHWSMLKSMFS